LLLRNDDPRLEAYVVWVPELGARESNVASATRLVPDGRASHYWDPNETIGISYGRLLPTPGSAWDVYMLFRPTITWDNTAPKPTYWMHQLSGVTNAPRLDARQFAAEAKRLLEQAG
jgi:hypothetical protein